MTERLDCGACDLSFEQSTMCGVVASRTIREMVKIGYDVSSDMKADVVTVAQAAQNNPQVEQILTEECGMRLLQLESTRKGYGTVVY